MRLQRFLGHSFHPGNDAAAELARRRGLLVPCAIPCSFAPLVFTRIRGVLPHFNPLTHRCSWLPMSRHGLMPCFSRFQSLVVSLTGRWRRTAYLNKLNGSIFRRTYASSTARCVLYCLRCYAHSLVLNSRMFPVAHAVI